MKDPKKTFLAEPKDIIPTVEEKKKNDNLLNSED